MGTFTDVHMLVLLHWSATNEIMTL